MIRFTTAGESHGKGLSAILEGVPAGMPLVADDVNRDLVRRMQGYGRGARMKIESDTVEFVSGVRAGETLGSPIALYIPNRDWENWADIMAAEPDGEDGGRRRQLLRPRPGHADLVGVVKYDRRDARDVLERASARETAARVACGAVCRTLLAHFGVEIGSHVVELGPVRAQPPDPLPVPLNDAADRSPVRCLDEAASEAMVAEIDRAKAAGDTLGGIIEVVARGVVVGLGSHVSWDRKLDGRLAAALMSIPAAKGVEIGLGFDGARRKGSEAHDELTWGGAPAEGGVQRVTNRAGGLEGGITTGQPIVLRVAKKPISTLMRPLGTVNIATGETAKAQAERSDVTAVPAIGVISEAMVAIVLADAMTEKFGGDTLRDLLGAYRAYLGRIEGRWRELGPRAERGACHIVLVGLPGAGKSTVGPLVAAELDRPFVDLDALIEEREKRSVPDIFAEVGEARFRDLERAAMELVAASPVSHVIAAGGGWAAQPGALESLHGRALTVYLETSPAEAAARVGGSPERPILRGSGGLEGRLEELLADRERYYARCDRRVATDGETPTQVASRILEVARIADVV